MHWIKEVEMVDSVDDLKSSRSIRGTHGPDFALQVHSGRSLFDPSLQDNAISPDGFFKYIYHVGCAINLLSIINSGLIPGGQILSNRNSNARFWSTRCEDCFSTEQNHHNSHFKRRVSLEEQKAKKEDRFFRGRQIAYLIYEYFRVTGANDSCDKKCRPIYNCSSKWLYSGTPFEMGRNSIKSHLMTSWKDCTS